MKEIGCIFDLDGVIVDTAKYHFKAWLKLANDLGFDFTAEDNEKLKGVSRVESLKLILKWGGVEKSEEEQAALAIKKNDHYTSLIDEMDKSEILPGVSDFLDDLKIKNIPFALGSASKNAPLILKKVGLFEDFKAIIDGNSVKKSKPDPEVFLKGAEALNLSPENCIVFEDAEKGVEAARNGGFLAVGVGDPITLGHAHIVISGFQDLNIDKLLEKLK